MQIDAVKLIYFSPTGSTRRVLRSIAGGMKDVHMVEIDLTPPDAAQRSDTLAANELALIGMPVYAGRLPQVAVARLKQLKGNRTPAVLVAVFGNRKFEDALLELSDLVKEAGFVPAAGAAFIGEHSYSTPAKPLSVGRPDESDLQKAAQFGREIYTKFIALPRVEDAPSLAVPGNRPYRELKSWEDTAPETDEPLCTLCGDCAAVCPTAAITVNGSVETDVALCIACCACVKVCPTDARVMRNANILRIADWLYENYSARQEPQIFL